jgi:hypothetical protein
VKLSRGLAMWPSEGINWGGSSALDDPRASKAEEREVGGAHLAPDADGDDAGDGPGRGLARMESGGVDLHCDALAGGQWIAEEVGCGGPIRRELGGVG